jgi:hypothetical protein
MAHRPIESVVNPHTPTSISTPTITTTLHPSVLSTLVHRARALYDHESLHDELEFLKDTFKRNSYGYRQIRRALDPPKRVTTTPEKPTLIAFFPFVNMTSSHISRMMSMHNIKSSAEENC